MARENTTIYIILGLLTHEDLSGYDMKKMIDHSISNFWEVGYGQIYPTLKLLEKEGLIRRRDEAVQKGPERIIYSITDEGIKELNRWLKLTGDREYIKYEILLKLFFGSMLSDSENVDRIKSFKESKIKQLASIEAAKDNLSKVLSLDRTHYYYYLTALFGEYIYNAYINWADEAMSILEKMEENNMKVDKTEDDKMKD